jgi:Transposase DDE domain
VPRDVHEADRDHVRVLDGKPAFEELSKQRKKVEMRFAHLKTHYRFERMRLRGLSGARDEFHLAAIVPSRDRRSSAPLMSAKWPLTRFKRTRAVDALGQEIGGVRANIVGFAHNPLDAATEKLLIPAALPIIKGMRSKKAQS